MALGYSKAPVENAGVALDASFYFTGGMETFYGMPKNVGTYTKMCALDYPKDLPYIVDIYGSPITGSTRNFDTWTVPAFYDYWETTQYCDGGATTLAAGAAIATAAFTMF